MFVKTIDMKCLFSRGLFFVARIFTADSLLAETISLSSLDLNQMTAGWSVSKADLDVVGRPISIGGKKFSRGVGTAPSILRVNLGADARRFTAQAGVHDSAGGQGSMEFVVQGDGNILWLTSAAIRSYPGEFCTISYAGKTVGLKLKRGKRSELTVKNETFY